VPPRDAPREEHIYHMVCSLLDQILAPSKPASYEVWVIDVPDGPIAKAKRIRVRVTAEAQNHPYRENRTLTLPVRSLLCDRCKRTSSGYFEAILQVRTSKGGLTSKQRERVVAFIQDYLSSRPEQPEVKVTRVQGGIDVKFHSSRVCRQIAKEMAAKFGLLLGVSTKVVGRRKTGEVKRRENYLVRFPPFQVGDVLAFDERVFSVTAFHHGRYVLVDLASGQRRTYTPKELASLQAEQLTEQIHEYLVISATPSLLQLMSQHDYTIYDLPPPPFPLPVGATIRAVAWRNRLHLLPPTET